MTGPPPPFPIHSSPTPPNPSIPIRSDSDPTIHSDPPASALLRAGSARVRVLREHTDSNEENPTTIPKKRNKAMVVQLVHLVAVGSAAVIGLDEWSRLHTVRSLNDEWNQQWECMRSMNRMEWRWGPG